MSDHCSLINILHSRSQHLQSIQGNISEVQKAEVWTVHSRRAHCITEDTSIYLSCYPYSSVTKKFDLHTIYTLLKNAKNYAEYFDVRGLLVLVFFCISNYWCNLLCNKIMFFHPPIHCLYQAFNWIAFKVLPCNAVLCSVITIVVFYLTNPVEKILF